MGWRGLGAAFWETWRLLERFSGVLERLCWGPGDLLGALGRSCAVFGGLGAALLGSWGSFGELLVAKGEQGRGAQLFWMLFGKVLAQFWGALGVFFRLV